MMEPNTLTKRAIARRWTPSLAERWTPVSEVFLKNHATLGITPAEAMLLVHLVSFKWDEHAPYPTCDTLAGRMGITDTSVRNHLRSLEKKGLLTRILYPGHANRFDLTPLFLKLEEVIKTPTVN